jgi:hypothetical protein
VHRYLGIVRVARATGGATRRARCDVIMSIARGAFC